MKWLGSVLILTCSIVLTACGDRVSSLKAIGLNSQAVENLVAEKYREALPLTLEALAHDPFNPEIQMNLGLSYEALEDYDRASQSYGMVLEQESISSELKFQALFNQARVEGNRQNLEKALALYQEALKIEPRSVEVKHNIELLFMGGGEGEGEGDDSGEGDGESDEFAPPEQNQEPQEPEDLSQQDVQKILEEINRQERQIRAKELDQQPGDPSDGKNW